MRIIDAHRSGKALIGWGDVPEMIMLDENTLTLGTYLSDTEFSKIRQHDGKRQGDDEKIIVEEVKSNMAIINPINLKYIVESGIITKLEIETHEDQDYLCESPVLQLMSNFGFKSLSITTSNSFTPHAEDIIKLIKGYEGTLDSLECRFAKVKMTDFSKIYEELENCTFLNMSLTAREDMNSNKQFKSIPEYNDMQGRLQFVMNCKHYLESFKTITKKEARVELCTKIINNNPEFTKNFGKYESAKINKFTGDHHIYNHIYETLKGYYIDNSKILNAISHLYEETGERLSDEAKKLIVKYSGGIAAITEIDNALENNNSTADQQDDVINQAEAMNDVDLTTSGTIADSDCSDGLLQS